MAFAAALLLKGGISFLLSGRGSHIEMEFTFAALIGTVLKVTAFGVFCGLLVGLFTKPTGNFQPKKSDAEAEQESSKEAAETLSQLGIKTNPPTVEKSHPESSSSTDG